MWANFKIAHYHQLVSRRERASKLVLEAPGADRSARDRIRKCEPAVDHDRLRCEETRFGPA